MPFTHVAKYQARVVADNIVGNARTARYDGIPRVMFADPEVAAVGLTRRQAERQGLAVLLRRGRSRRLDREAVDVRA